MDEPDNNLEFSDNFKLTALRDGEIRLTCVCGAIVYSSIDCDPRWPVSLATLIDAAEDHEVRHAA